MEMKTIKLEQPVAISQPTHMDRRAFVAGMGAMAGTLATTGAAMARAAEIGDAGTGEQPKAAQENDVLGVSTVATPGWLAEQGGTSMSLDEINRLRHELVDSKGDLECTDGSVVPAVWNKLRALINSYSVGCGSDLSEATPANFEYLQMLFTEDEAQAYLEMPFGVLFSAAEFAEVSGRDEAECLELCDNLAMRGLLFRCHRAGVAYFHQLAEVHGLFEYGLCDYYTEGWAEKRKNFAMPDSANNYCNSGTAFYYAIPCSREVVADEQGVLPLEDWEKIVDRNEVLAVAPCQCRLFGMVNAGEPEPPAIGTEELKDFRSPLNDQYLETCIVTGEEAQYYLDRGVARAITKEEARSILQRSVDEGMILQSAFTKDSCVICSCKGDSCGILKKYQAIGAGGCEVATCMPNNSHYNLVYDKDACIQCGACVERCPMFAITMDDESYPVVDARCMRCGQCGLACPVDARKIEAKDASERIELPGTMLDDYNLKAAYRFEHGLLY